MAFFELDGAQTGEHRVPSARIVEALGMVEHIRPGLIPRSGNFKAHHVLFIDTQGPGDPAFYLAPPDEIEQMVRERGLAYAQKPKRDGATRSLGFRKELPSEAMAPWRDRWDLLGLPIARGADAVDHRKENRLLRS